MVQQLVFNRNGLKSKDITQEEVRMALGLPKTKIASVAVKFHKGPGGWDIAPKAKAVVDPEMRKVYKVLSKDYRFIPHEQGILDMTRAAEANPEFGKIEWKVKGHDDFRRMRATGVFSDLDYEVKSGDVIHPQVEYFNSYDGSWSERFIFGAYRVVCSNGLTIGEKFATETARHVGTVDRDSFVIKLDKALHDFSMQNGIWKGWLDKEVNLAHLNQVEELGLNQNEKAEVVAGLSENPGMNLWLFYNIITALITHGIRSLNKQVRTWDHLRRESSNW